MPKRTQAELEELISVAVQLGFYDDVTHWTNELYELLKEAKQ